MTDDTRISREIAREMYTVFVEAAMKDGATFGDLFDAFEIVFGLWLSLFNDDNEREEAAREFIQHIPQMLKSADAFAAANSDGVQRH